MDPEFDDWEYREVTREEWEAYVRDRAAEPPDLPTPEEVEKICRDLGAPPESTPPF